MSDLAWLRPRLAELCGINVGKCDYAPTVESWRPDEDVAQAIRCLEAARDSHTASIYMWNHGGYSVRLRYVKTNRQIDIADAPTLQQAICLAIASAMRWETPDE